MIGNGFNNNRNPYEEDLSTGSGTSPIDPSTGRKINDVNEFLNLEENDFQPKLEEDFEMK